MKTLTKGFMLIVIFILFLLISMSIGQKYVKSSELNRITAQAIQETQRVMVDQRYKIQSNNEYLAEFSQNLIRLSSACQDLNINVYGIDYQSGLLDVKVTTPVYYLNGRLELLSIRKTSIIDVDVSELGD